MKIKGILLNSNLLILREVLLVTTERLQLKIMIKPSMKKL